MEDFTRALDRYGKTYEVQWYENMPHCWARISPDAEVPTEQRAAADLSYERSFAW